jgi:hypothetical protein
VAQGVQRAVTSAWHQAYMKTDLAWVWFTQRRLATGLQQNEKCLEIRENAAYL